MPQETRLDAQGVANELRAAIDAGELRSGEKLPTVGTLSEQYGVNKNTVSKAIAQLKTAGILSGSQGGATRVRVKPPFSVRDNRNYHDEKSRVLLSEEERAKVGSFEQLTGISVKDLPDARYIYDVVKCPTDICKLLALSENALVLKRTYIRRYIENAGISKSCSFIPYDIVRDFPKLLDSGQEPWPGGTFHQLHTAGVEAGRMEDRISARMPTPKEAKEFDVPPGVPMFHLTKVTYDINERPVEVALIPTPGDRIEFLYSTPLDRWK